MREIKFRAWNEVLEKMYSWNEFLNTNMKQTFIAPESTAMILMQYTGLHDKNGKEIYEGDIVELKAENGCCNILGKIIYDDYDLAFELIDEEGNQEALWYAEQELEIKGNIYENPELLKE